MRKKIFKTVSVFIIIIIMYGCSATSLRCAVDGDSSYVELYNIPQNFSQNVRAYGELCAFAYEQEIAHLNIIGE